MMYTDDEITEIAKEDWKKVNTWDLSYDDFIKLSFVSGEMGNGRMNGMDNKPEDVVYISPSGSSMTRSMCSYWMRDWMSFHHGFVRAWKMWAKHVS